MDYKNSALWLQWTMKLNEQWKMNNDNNDDDSMNNDNHDNEQWQQCTTMCYNICNVNLIVIHNNAYNDYNFVVYCYDIVMYFTILWLAW